MGHKELDLSQLLRAREEATEAWNLWLETAHTYELTVHGVSDCVASE
jgi:hypothetical protein